ncbi:neprilysin-4 [Anabrus simplex]|uniref:neprilysin-4 n=1 Tax=Anabrus simplex TaxID=316456 RepID=UPI0035A2E74D
MNYLLPAVSTFVTVSVLSPMLIGFWNDQKHTHTSFQQEDYLSEIAELKRIELEVIEHDPEHEKSEFEERMVLPDLQTEYMPSRMLSFSIRKKRDLENDDSWNTYQGNETTDQVIWSIPASNNNYGNYKYNKPRKYAFKNHKTSSDEMKTLNNSPDFESDFNDSLSSPSALSKVLEIYAETNQSEDFLSTQSPYNGTKEDEPQPDSDDGDPEDGLIYDVAENLEHLSWVNLGPEDEATAWEINSTYTYLSEIIKNETEMNRLYDLRKKQSLRMQSFMDVTADPCDDFYQYACGNWMKRNPIPKDKAGFDTFEILRENLDWTIKELLEEPIEYMDSNSSSSDAVLKAKQLYQSCMNHDIIQTRSTEPLRTLLRSLGGWPMLEPAWKSSKFDLVYLMARLRLYNNDILLSQWIGPDIKYSNEYIIQFDQTTLGLPTRDYFLEPLNKRFLEAYKEFVVRVATLLGVSRTKATKTADDIVDFETELARITSSADQRRNVSELYQRLTVGELQHSVPQIDWLRYLNLISSRTITSSEPCVMFAMRYVQDLVKLLSKTHKRTLANYMLWRFVRHRINNLDERFEEAKQQFYSILFGRETSPPRWKNCVGQVNSNMGMAVGAMFVKKYFDENSKTDTLHMTEGIMQSFRELLEQTTWLDEKTKQRATTKVDAMKLRIGYPDFILDSDKLDKEYSDVTIHPEQYFENTLNILEHLTRKEQGRLGKPVDKSTWNTAPAVVNAYYSRNKNQIMFPAGILQPPFYHRYFPRSLNYGGIGVVIGHEIVHGFDDKGRLFDEDGNLHRWWNEDAITSFHERAQCLIDQYSHYEVEEVDVRIDGVNTQGENIADNGGVKQAFRAYKNWLSVHGDAYETLPDFNVTDLQLFFINFAQVWCGETRPEATINKLKTAVHATGRYRVIGTLSNSEEFAEVFNCTRGSPMNPPEKCSVW